MVLDLMEKEPDDRPQNPSDLIAEVTHVLEAPQRARRRRAQRATQRPKQKRRRHSSCRSLSCSSSLVLALQFGGLDSAASPEFKKYRAKAQTRSARPCLAEIFRPKSSLSSSP